MTYHQQMQHPNWQKKRLEVMEDRSFECESCGAEDEQLHVHHPFYRRGAMLWEYDKDELMCLCHKCHKDEHAIDEKLKKEMSTLTASEKLELLGRIKASKDTIAIKLESDEEITGFLSYYGIAGKLRHQLARDIIKCDGSPSLFEERSETTFHDIMRACNEQADIPAIVASARTKKKARVCKAGKTQGGIR